MSKAIKPPRKSKKREVARAVIEAAAQSNPLTGGLVRIYQTTHPSESERDCDRWEKEMTGRLNELLQGPRVLAMGTISAVGLSGDEGWSPVRMAAVTDERTGCLSVALDTASEGHYHVSTELPRGRANVSDKSPASFLVRTFEHGEPMDTEVNIALIGGKP